ncbi:MAG: histidine kinase [Bacteroidales bacterium]|jgi:signal transduction histidine kinase|nr:histidine kinase [Bacteroidales bacterium]
MTRMKKPKTTIFLSLFIFCAGLHAQQYDNNRNRIDSLVQAAEHISNNADKALLYVDIGDMYLGFGDIAHAKQYYIKARDLSEKIEYLYGMLCYTVSMGDILRFEGHYDSALVLNLRMLELALQQDDESVICKSYVNLGLNYENKGWWETALNNYLKALSIANKNNSSEALGVIYDKLQLLYHHIGNAVKGIDYGEKAIEYLQGDSRLAEALINLSQNYIDCDKFAKAEQCLQQLDSLLQPSPSVYLEAEMEAMRTYLSIETGHWDRAQQHAKKAYELYDVLKYPARMNEMLIIQVQDNIYHHQLEEAKSKLESILSSSEAFQFLSVIAKSMVLFSEIALMEHDFEAQRQWKHRADSVWNVISNESLMRTTEELVAKYETEKKDIQIASLAKEKHLFLFIAIVLSVLVLLILAILLYRNRLHQRQKQLIATQAALESETAERSRLAKDLHDGLGGMLSLVKMNLSDMKIMEQEDAESFNKALNMLDVSIVELRRVAHHIMPESLIRDGLKTSLEDFAQAIPVAEFHFYGEEKRMDRDIEITLYRSAYELVNNAIKHAQAKHINIQLVQEPDRISLIVADDGKGFDTKQDAKGMGLKNIKNRISVHNGEMYIFSDSVSGTEINIEMKLRV